jgi:hypothetical protein
VYVDRSIYLGGRFYGPWYQGIPKEYREHILINGSPVCEPDFSGYHPRILYSLNGVSDRLVADPYKLDGYPDTPEMRSFLKPLLLMIVNAKDEQSAIGAIRRKRSKAEKKAQRWGRELKPLGVEIRTDAQYRDVIQKLMAIHEPISNFFYSSMGAELQHLDSQIAEAIMLIFAHHLNMAVLPMHDSFIVDHRQVELLEETMSQVTELALRERLPVKPGMGGVQKHIDLVDRLYAEGKPDPFDATFNKAFMDDPQKDRVLCSLKKEARERVDEVRDK